MSSSRRRDFASHDEATCPTSSEKVSPATLQATWPSLSQNHLKHCLGSFSLLLLLLSSTKHFLNKHARYWAGQGVCWSWGEGRTARGIRNRTGPEAAYCLCGRPDSRVVPGGCSAQREAQKGRITHNPALFLLTSVLSAYMLSVEQIPPACACSAFTAVSANGTLILHWGQLRESKRHGLPCETPGVWPKLHWPSALSQIRPLRERQGRKTVGADSVLQPHQWHGPWLLLPEFLELLWEVAFATVISTTTKAFQNTFFKIIIALHLFLLSAYEEL